MIARSVALVAVAFPSSPALPMPSRSRGLSRKRAGSSHISPRKIKPSSSTRCLSMSSAPSSAQTSSAKSTPRVRQSAAASAQEAPNALKPAKESDIPQKINPSLDEKPTGSIASAKRTDTCSRGVTTRSCWMGMPVGNVCHYIHLNPVRARLVDCSAAAGTISDTEPVDCRAFEYGAGLHRSESGEPPQNW